MKRLLSKSKLISSFFAASLASTAFAGEGGGESSSPDAVLPEVVVTGSKGYNPGTSSLPKTTQPLLDTPQSVTVMPQELLEDQGVTTMRQALRNVSGISLAAGEGSSQGDNLTIRGFTARSDFYLDGMRDFGSYYRDPFNLQAIEVLQGPSSIMFGRGSTGGAVNQQSKSPSLDPSTEASFAVGSDGTRRATADIDRPLSELGKNAAFRIGVMGDEGGVAGRNVAYNSRYGFAPSVSLGLGTPNRLTLKYFHQSENDVPDYGLPWMFGSPAQVDRRSFYGFSSDYLKADADVVSAKGEHDFNDRLTLREQLRYADYERNARITEPQIVNTATPNTPLAQLTVNRNEIAVISTEGTLQSQTDLLAKFDTGPVRHDALVGIEADHETSAPTITTYTGVPTTNLVTPDASPPFSGTGAITSAVNAQVDTYAFYLLDTMHLGEYFDLIGGGRWDHIWSYFSQKVAPTPSFFRLDELPSWRAALVFKPKPTGSVYFAAGTSFDPSAEQLALTAATANIAPEENQTYEFGSKWDFVDGRLSANASLFRDQMLNAREVDPNNPLQDILSGTQRVDGFQASLRGAVTEKWQVFAGYTYLKSKVVSSAIVGEAGRPLANAPRNTLDLWSDWKLPKDFEFGLGANAVSARAASTTVSTTASAEAGFIGQAPGYAVFNAMIKRQMTKKMSLQLAVTNLFDTFYYDGIHPGHIVPGAGRTFLVTMNWKF